MKRPQTLALVVLSFSFAIAGVFFALPPNAPLTTISVNELILRSSEHQGIEVQLQGQVLASSIEQKTNTLEHRFLVTPEGAWEQPSKGPLLSVEVRYDGIMPDSIWVRSPYRCGAQVLLTGALEGDIFYASKVLAKCPSKYESVDEKEEVNCPSSI